MVELRPDDVQPAPQGDASHLIFITGFQLPQNSDLPKPQPWLFAILVRRDDAADLGEEVSLCFLHKSCGYQFSHAALVLQGFLRLRFCRQRAHNREREPGIKSDVRK